jgi:hypothetical protein
MQELMRMGVKVVCTLNGMVFDGTATDAPQKAIHESLLAFMAAQGEADYVLHGMQRTARALSRLRNTLKSLQPRSSVTAQRRQPKPRRKFYSSFPHPSVYHSPASTVMAARGFVAGSFHSHILAGKQRPFVPGLYVLNRPLDRQPCATSPIIFPRFDSQIPTTGKIAKFFCQISETRNSLITMAMICIYEETDATRVD